MSLEANVRDLLSRPNFAHLATLMPMVRRTYSGVDRSAGDHILIGTGEGSLKVRNLRRDPRLALSVVDFHNPYEEVQIRGHVVEFRDDSQFGSWTKSRVSTPGKSSLGEIRQDALR